MRNVISFSWADPEGGGQRVQTSMKYHKLPYVSLEILVRTPSTGKDPLG